MRLLAAAALLALLPSANAQMYKCVDARGVTFYSDKPQPGCKGDKVDIQASPPLGGGAAPRPPQSFAGQDAEFKRRQIERDQAELQEKQQVAMRCAKLRNEYSVLASGGRIYQRNSLGERVYLEDSTRDTRLAQLKEEMRRCP
jgi:uncharacterized protein DUF4124